MSKTTYTGIDYGHAQTNIDNATGIRYGVISQSSINPDAISDVWGNARDLSYENAVDEVKKELRNCYNRQEIHSVIGSYLFSSRLAELVIESLDDFQFTRTGELSEQSVESIWADMQDGFNDSYECDDRDWLYESNGYKLTNCLQSDVFVLASPYYTYAQFCSPCVPGGCNLDSPLDPVGDWPKRDNQCYCLGHDYFEGNKAPYPVYSVATGEIVNP